MPGFLLVFLSPFLSLGPVPLSHAARDYRRRVLCQAGGTLAGRRGEDWIKSSEEAKEGWGGEETKMGRKDEEGKEWDAVCGREQERGGGGVSEHHLMDYLLKCDVAPGCSFLWHQSNLGERQTWLLHRAQSVCVCVCVCVGVGEEVNPLTHHSNSLQHVLPSLPPTALCRPI